MTTDKQDKDFNKMFADELPKSMLQNTIDWIRDNLNPDQVFEMAALVKFVSNTKLPDEVFSEEELKQWAIDNGFTPPATRDSLLPPGWKVPEQIEH